MRSLPFALGVLAIGSIACASAAPNPSVGPTSAPASSAPLGPEETLPPEVVRCGVDDAPVPVGTLRAPPDRRLALLGAPPALVAMAEPSPARAMLPTVDLSVRADGVGLPPPALVAIFQVCGEQAQPTDVGELALSVGFGSNGAPRTSRPGAGTNAGPGPSPFARCLAERACRLPVIPALAGKTLIAQVGTKLTPPVFRGRVEASVSFVPTRPGPQNQWPTKALQTRMNVLQKLLEDAADGCAKRLPPADDLSLAASFELAAGVPKDFAFQPSVDHGEVLRSCIESSLTASFKKLTPEPKLSATFNVFVHMRPEPNGPPGATE